MLAVTSTLNGCPALTVDGAVRVISTFCATEVAAAIIINVKLKNSLYMISCSLSCVLLSSTFSGISLCYQFLSCDLGRYES